MAGERRDDESSIPFQAEMKLHYEILRLCIVSFNVHISIVVKCFK